MCRFTLTQAWRLISGSAWLFSESSRRLQDYEKGNPDCTNVRRYRPFSSMVTLDTSATPGRAE